MAAIFQEGAPQRRKMAMYGKTARRRIPEFSFAAMAQKGLTPEVFEMPEEVAKTNLPLATRPAAIRPATPTKLKAIARTSPARSQASSTSQNENVYDVPDSGSETLKKAPAPALKTKPKSMRQKQVVKATKATTSATLSSASTADVWDVPSDDPAPKSMRQRATTPVKPKSIRQKQTTKLVRSNSSFTSDVWDVPDDDQVPKTIRQRATTPLRIKLRARKSPSITPVPSPKKITGSDVPSDNEERHSPSTKRNHQTMQKPATSQLLRITEVLQPVPEGSNKKLRLSPARDSAVRHPLVKIATTRASKTLPATKSSQSRNRSPGHLTQMVARPNIRAPAKKPEIVRAIRQVTPQPKRIQSSTSTPPISKNDVEMPDAVPDLSKQQMSPRGLKMLQNLINSVENSDEECGAKPAEKVATPRAASSAFGGILSRPAGVIKPLQRSPNLLPRRRLIDSLVEQKPESEDEDSDSSNLMSDSFLASQQSVDILEISESQVAPQLVSRPAMMASDSQTSQCGPRVTYARVRSFINEQDLMEDLQMEFHTQSASNAGPRRVGIPGLKTLASFKVDEEDEENTPAIRSVHELRLAGVNNRFMDGVQDCLGQIGKPGKTPAAKSSRRAGLMDLASRMKDKGFLRQFRDNGIEQKLFLHLDQETDIVSGFLIVSLLISVLLEGNMPHLISQLRQNGITRLIIRLLECQSSVVAIGRERKSNMSKIAQTLLAEHHDHLLHISAWENVQPEVLSPQTIALKCLEIMIIQTRKSGLTGDFISKELATMLFAILSSASDMRCWDLPKDKLAIDFYLALSILESYSLVPRTLHEDAIWISEYLPIIASTLEVAVAKVVDDFGKLQMLLLQITLDMTINNPDTCEVFAKSSLLSVMARAVVIIFKKILPLTDEDPAVVLLLNHLILILAAMWNIAEFTPIARELLQDLQGHDEDPLESMINIFTENREKISTADSLEETVKNAPFGHLSILLGQLALLPAISKRIQNSQPRKTLSPLIESIEEFMRHDRTVDEQLEHGEDGHNPQAVFTERLEDLVSKLTRLH